MRSFATFIRPSLALAFITLLGFAGVYAVTATAINQVVFYEQANGSLVEVRGRFVGSTWVAQPFHAEGYLQSRPSAANYDPMAVAGSNLAMSNPELAERVRNARELIMQREKTAQIPSDLITQSASGSDPHISPAAAQLQAQRIAAARQVNVADVAAVIREQTQGRTWGVLGAERVNVLNANVELDRRYPIPR